MTAIGMGIGIPFNQQGFSPFAVGQPAFDIDLARGVTLNGPDIASILDQSGGGNTVLQGTAADQPLFNASDSDFNGRPSMTLDGVSEFLESAPLSASLSQPNTIIAVFKFDVAPTNDPLFDSTPGRQLFFGTGSAIQMYAGTQQTTGIIPGTSPRIAIGLFDGASSDAWMDGTQGTPAGTVGTETIDNIIIGTNAAKSIFTSGKIARVFGYNFELSDIQRNYVGGGLSSIYGTTNGWS